MDDECFGEKVKRYSVLQLQWERGEWDKGPRSRIAGEIEGWVGILDSDVT